MRMLLFCLLIFAISILSMCSFSTTGGIFLDSPQSSPTTTLMITPPPPLSTTPTPTPLAKTTAERCKSSVSSNIVAISSVSLQPAKITTASTRNRSKTVVTPATFLNKGNDHTRRFNVGELIWGPARGHTAWPGKVLRLCDENPDAVWVQWFGGCGGGGNGTGTTGGSSGRFQTELLEVNLLQSLSEGLEAHHTAQKDTRK